MSLLFSLWKALFDGKTPLRLTLMGSVEAMRYVFTKCAGGQEEKIGGVRSPLFLLGRLGRRSAQGGASVV